MLEVSPKLRHCRVGKASPPRRNRIVLSRWLPVAVAFLAAACAPDRSQDASYAWSGSLEQGGSLTVVRNPREPLLPAPEVSIAPVWEISGDEPGGSMPIWQRPTRIALGDGEIFILDELSRQVHVLDRSGEWMRTIGREGGGPGEFLRPYALLVADRHLIVGDGGKGSLEVLGFDGSHVRTVRLGGMGFGAWGLDRRILVHVFTGGATEWREYDIDGGFRVRHLPPGPSLPGFPEADCAQRGSGGAALLQLNCSTPVFHLVDATGTATKLISIDRPASVATPEEFREMERRFAREIAQVGYGPEQTQALAREQAENFRVKRAMQSVRQDLASGIFAIWEQEPEELGGGDATLHLLSPEGVFLSSVPFSTSWIDFQMDESRVYALVADPETGLARVQAYEVRIPPEALAFSAAIAGGR
jgi:hypothetical protein